MRAMGLCAAGRNRGWVKDKRRTLMAIQRMTHENDCEEASRRQCLIETLAHLEGYSRIRSFCIIPEQYSSHRQTGRYSTIFPFSDVPFFNVPACP